MNNARFVAKNSILLGRRMSIGTGTWIGYFCLLDGQLAKLTIGKQCEIASGVHIYTHSTHIRCLTGKQKDKTIGPVKLGNRVFVGAHSIILPNTKIGSRSIVVANSTVEGVFPPQSLIAGSPAQIRKRIRL